MPQQPRLDERLVVRANYRAPLEYDKASLVSASYAGRPL
jgi:hypothetical protein